MTLPLHPPRRRRPLILYATETGTSKDLATTLSATLSRLHISSTLLPAQSLAQPLSTLPTYEMAFFIFSTTGQGEMPRAAMAFWKQLCRRKILSNWLAGTWYAVFGVGDSSYTKFCWAARMLDRRLRQLGAWPVRLQGCRDHVVNEEGERMEEEGLVCGDQSAEEGVDGAFSWWEERIREFLLSEWGLPEGMKEIGRDVLLPPKRWVELESDSGDGIQGDLEPRSCDGGDNGRMRSNCPSEDNPNGSSKCDASGKKILADCGTTHIRSPGSLLTTLASSNRVTPETHFQDVRHMTFALPHQMVWEPGDVLSLMPKNDTADVEAFLNLQHLQSVADIPLSIHTLSVPSSDLPISPILHLVTPLTLRTLLTHHLDITCIPRRSFFAAAACLSTDPFQRDRLREFTDPALVDELWNYTTRPRRTLLEVLQEFDSVHIPVERLLDMVPAIRERQFSIASCCKGSRLGETSMRKGSRTVELLVAVVRYKTVLRKPRRGLCTHFLSSLEPGAEVVVSFSKGSLFPPASSPLRYRPAILIGPGTGIAPLRALLWERVHALDGSSSNILFPAHRYRCKDYFFREEWELLEREGLLRGFPAFSRDAGEEGGKRRYVQSVIMEKKDVVGRLVCEEDAVVYVCGSSGKMPKAVREAMVDVVDSWFRDHYGDGTMVEEKRRERAQRFVELMEKDGRWRQETWG